MNFFRKKIKKFWFRFFNLNYVLSRYLQKIRTTEYYCNRLYNGTTKMGSMILNGASTTSRSNLSNTVPCSIYQNDDLSSDEPSTKSPNIALISLILLIGTCVVALLLKKLRRSMFFGAYVRRTLSDVGILISIVFKLKQQSAIFH